MVGLDSGGPNGQKELSVILEAAKAEGNIKCLILDDLDRIKHKESPKRLHDELGVDVYQVEARWGFAIID
jgi:hypothetical protein